MATGVPCQHACAQTVGENRMKSQESLCTPAYIDHRQELEVQPESCWHRRRFHVASDFKLKPHRHDDILACGVVLAANKAAAVGIHEE